MGPALPRGPRERRHASRAVSFSVRFSGFLRHNGRTIVLTNGELVINKNLSILGPGATNLAISGGGSNRVFYINPGVTNLIASLTITNGNGVSAFFSGYGGGILNLGTLTVSNCTLSGNSANPGSGGCARSDERSSPERCRRNHE